MGGGARPAEPCLFTTMKGVLLSSLMISLAGCVVHVETDSRAAAVLGLGVVAAHMYAWEMGRPPEPQMAPDRTVNEQDCTKPIDLTGGNLLCK